MPSGRLTKVDMESRVLKIYEELNRDLVQIACWQKYP